jgi:hypothetical protein
VATPAVAAFLTDAAALGFLAPRGAATVFLAAFGLAAAVRPALVLAAVFVPRPLRPAVEAAVRVDALLALAAPARAVFPAEALVPPLVLAAAPRAFLVLSSSRGVFAIGVTSPGRACSSDES